MTKLKQLTIGFALLLSGTLARAQQPLEFSLEESILYAVENSPKTQNARFDEYIAKAKVGEILAEGLPQFNADASLGYQYRIQKFVIVGPEGEPTTFEAALPGQVIATANLSQLVFDARFFIGLKATRSLFALQKKQTNLTAEDIALNVSQAYYTGLISRESVAILEKNIDRLDQLLQETRALFDNGFAEEIDVERLQISKNNLEIDLKEARRFTQYSKDVLKFQMGMDINTQITLTEPIEPLRNIPESVSMADFDMNSRIEYNILNEQRQLQTYSMKRYQSGYFPSLYAFGNYRYDFTWDAQTSINYDAGSVGLQLNVPIFDGMRKKNQIAQTKLEIQKIETDMAQLQNAINLEVKNSWREVQNTYDNLQSRQNNVKLATKVYRVSEIKYKEGVGSGLELNDADSRLIESEIKFLQAALEYLVAKAKLQRARGEFAQYHIN